MKAKFTWDAENRLYAMETTSLAYAAGAPRRRIEYSYDDRGRRAGKTVYSWNSSAQAFNATPSAKVGFLYQDWNLIQEVDLSGTPSTLRSYVWGLDLSGTLQGAGGVGGLLAADLVGDGLVPVAYAHDANGNVSDLVAFDDGSVGDHYEYDPFGNVLVENGTWTHLNPFRFSTKYTDTDAAVGGNETGLIYYGFRYYSPSTGRFANRDPIAERGGVNLYGMVGNDSVNHHDSFGLEIWDYEKIYSESPNRDGTTNIDEVKVACEGANSYRITFNIRIKLPAVGLFASNPDPTGAWAAVDAAEKDHIADLEHWMTEVGHRYAQDAEDCGCPCSPDSIARVLPVS